MELLQNTAVSCILDGLGREHGQQTRAEDAAQGLRGEKNLMALYMWRTAKEMQQQRNDRLTFLQ